MQKYKWRYVEMEQLVKDKVASLDQQDQTLTILASKLDQARPTPHAVANSATGE